MANFRRNLSYDTLVAAGVIEGWHHFNKFGRNTDIGATEETVWAPGGQHTWVAAPANTYVACTDNINGIGQVLRIQGVGPDWLLVDTTVTLNGTTPVLIDTPLAVIHRAYQVSAEPDPVGDVWFGRDNEDFVLGVPQTQTDIAGFIDFSNAAQITEQCLVLVPATHYAIIHGLHMEMAQPQGTARNATVMIEIAELAVEATVDNPSWAPRHRVIQEFIDSENTSTTHRVDIKFPVTCPPLTRIEARALASASSDIVADMAVQLVPKEVFE
jgi:hypothetical protein